MLTNSTLAVVVSLYMPLSQESMGSVEVKVSSGQLEVSKEKNLLVWVLGMSVHDIHFSFQFISIISNYITDMSVYLLRSEVSKVP